MREAAADSSSEIATGAQILKRCIAYDLDAELSIAEIHNAHSNALLELNKQPWTLVHFRSRLARTFTEVQVVQGALTVRGLKYTPLSPAAVESRDADTLEHKQAEASIQPSQTLSNDRHNRPIKAELESSSTEGAAARPPPLLSAVPVDLVARTRPAAGVASNDGTYVPSIDSDTVKTAMGYLILDSPDHLMFHQHLDTVISACPSVSASIHGLDGVIDLVQARAQEFGITRDLSLLNKMLRGMWLQQHVSHLAKEIRSCDAFVQVAASILKSGVQHHGPDFTDRVQAHVKQMTGREATAPP